MAILKIDKVSEVMLQNHVLIPVVSRLGIKAGVENKTVEDVCRENGLHPDFFLAVVNVFLYGTFDAVEDIRLFNVLKCLDYIRKSHKDFIVQLKNIERHIRLLVNDGNAQYMSLIFSLFNEYKEELSSLIGKEESLFLPYVNNVYELFFSPDYQPIEGDVAGALSVFVSEYNDVNEKLDDLKNILIKYIQGDYDENIFYGVIFALDRLQRDINATELIELKVLEPMVAKMEREITERVSKMQGL